MSELLKYICCNRTAIIVLHEIYGINDFIKDRCAYYHAEGYDVFCPNLFSEKTVFAYDAAKDAYYTYTSKVGFDVYQTINAMAMELKQRYANVILLGFSVGATVAWRCSANSVYSGIICCYGSRIRDYLAVTPTSPALLIFAKQDLFDVVEVASMLYNRINTTVEIIDAKHGFADCYSANYSQPAAELLDQLVKDFLTTCST